MEIYLPSFVLKMEARFDMDSIPVQCPVCRQRFELHESISRCNCGSRFQRREASYELVEQGPACADCGESGNPLLSLQTGIKVCGPCIEHRIVEANRDAQLASRKRNHMLAQLLPGVSDEDRLNFLTLLVLNGDSQ